MRRRLRGYLAFGGWLACGVAAPAQPLAASVFPEYALDYHADAACPDRERFLAFLKEALAVRYLPDLSRTADLRIRVDIRTSDEGFRGWMEKTDRSGISDPRLLSSAGCEEVAQALALTTAFSIVASADQEPVPSVLRPLNTAAMRGPSPHIAAGSGRWIGAIGASAGGWLSPEILMGIEASGGRIMPIRTGRAPVAASLRLRATYVRNDWMREPTSARFALLTGALEACALTRPSDRGIEVGLCTTAESGWLRGRGVQIAVPRVGDSMWLAVGGGPLVRLWLGQRWQLEARGAAVLPLRRVHFAFDAPAQPVAETSGVGWTTALGLVTRFP